MTNPYRKHLDTYFETLNSFKHSTQRLKTVLLKDAEKYKTDGSDIKIGTTLFIEDWSSKIHNVPFPTGASKLTTKEQYTDEVNGMLTREYGYVFAQCFEALERFMKKCLREKSSTNAELQVKMSKKKYSSNDQLRGGYPLFELFTVASRKSYSKYRKIIFTRRNFELKELFQIYAEIRHAVIHNLAAFEVKKATKVKQHRMELVKSFFQNRCFNESTGKLHFDYNDFIELYTDISDFGFQMFKLLSEEDGLDWQIQ